MAATQTSGLPSWMLDSKDDITRRPEWNGFVEELYDAIKQQMQESQIQAFSDLTDPERHLLTERAAKAIHGGKSYSDLYSNVSESLDQHLNGQVARQLLEDNPVHTKTDLILDCAQEGAVSLLKKWPDMKDKLHVCFNQPLPEALRPVAWRLFLENTLVRKKYVDLLTNNPRAAISRQDLEISQKCEELVLTEPTFVDLKGSVGAFYALKAVLSYHHAMKRTDAGLPDVVYLLTVPFVHVASPSLSRRQPAGGHVVALLVEEFFSFMQSRPGFMVDSGTEVQEEELKSFIDRVAGHLQANGQAAALAISNAFVPAKETIVATESGTHAVLTDGLRTLAQPLIRSLFVGYVHMDVVLFLWDQYIIGLNSPGFHEDYLAAITAVFFMLLTDQLKQCETPSALEVVMRSEGVKLKVPQFQYEIRKHFQEDLFKKLTQDDRAALPVLDPTQARLPPWVHWFSENVPPRTTPRDRMLAREEREAERERLRQQERETERRRREREEQARMEDEDRFLEQQAEDQRRRREEQLAMENQLEEEIRRRRAVERDAAAEIERLQMEIEALRRQKQKSPSPSMMSLESTISRYLIPPPPTAASHFSPMSAIMEGSSHGPTLGKPQSDKVNDILKDILAKVGASLHTVGHGTGRSLEELDQHTRELILQHNDDVKHAETEVFGRRLQPGEFEALGDEEKEKSSDRIMAVIKRRIEDRRQYQQPPQQPPQQPSQQRRPSQSQSRRPSQPQSRPQSKSRQPTAQ